MSLLGALLAVSALLSPATIMSQGTTRQHVIALTFDAGADRGYAPQILRTLEKNHVHASFGMTGRWAKLNPDLVRRMARDGDMFINHTYDHRSFTGLTTRTAPLTASQRAWEIETADKIIHALTGHSSKPYFRLPYGEYDASALTQLRRLGYRYVVMWTLDTLGWEGVSASTIVQRCIANLRPGAIVLMHVGIQSQDGPALPAVIRAVKARHYRFVTVKALTAYH